MVSEKVGGVEGTKLDEDFKDLERVNSYVLREYHELYVLDCLVYSCILL